MKNLANKQSVNGEENTPPFYYSLQSDVVVGNIKTTEGLLDQKQHQIRLTIGEASFMVIYQESSMQWGSQIEGDAIIRYMNAGKVIGNPTDEEVLRFSSVIDANNRQIKQTLANLDLEKVKAENIHLWYDRPSTNRPVGIISDTPKWEVSSSAIVAGRIHYEFDQPNNEDMKTQVNVNVNGDRSGGGRVMVGPLLELAFYLLLAWCSYPVIVVYGMLSNVYGLFEALMMVLVRLRFGKKSEVHRASSFMFKISSEEV